MWCTYRRWCIYNLRLCMDFVCNMWSSNLRHSNRLCNQGYAHLHTVVNAWATVVCLDVFLCEFAGLSTAVSKANSDPLWY